LRPAFVDIRLRHPCVRFRRIRLGLKVKLTSFLLGPAWCGPGFRQNRPGSFPNRPPQCQADSPGRPVRPVRLESTGSGHDRGLFIPIGVWLPPLAKMARILAFYRSFGLTPLDAQIHNPRSPKEIRRFRLGGKLHLRPGENGCQVTSRQRFTGFSPSVDNPG
jgi:hypothetical protein